MPNRNAILQVNTESFRANLYTSYHFRMIGLVDVKLALNTEVETVTLAFYSSSGTNSGKIRGLWYPIVGIKLTTGAFTEFTPAINKILTSTTHYGSAHKGWLAKSLFFYHRQMPAYEIPGFSYTSYYKGLLQTGRLLSSLYNEGRFKHLPDLDAYALNRLVTSHTVYPGNMHSQVHNYEHFLQDIFYKST